MVVIVPRNTEIVRKFLKYRTTRWSCAFEWNETNDERGGNWLRHDTNRETFTTQLYELVIRSISSILRAPKWKYANLWKNKNYKSPFYMLCMKAVWYAKRWRETMAGLRTIFHEYYYGNMRYIHMSWLFATVVQIFACSLLDRVHQPRVTFEFGYRIMVRASSNVSDTATTMKSQREWRSFFAPNKTFSH